MQDKCVINTFIFDAQAHSWCTAGLHAPAASSIGSTRWLDRALATMSEKFKRGSASLNMISATTGESKKRLRSELLEAVQTETPYGDLGKVMSFGEKTKVPYICPFAFLSALTQKSWRYAKFLGECRGAKTVLAILLYTDEVVPGLHAYLYAFHAIWRSSAEQHIFPYKTSDIHFFSRSRNPGKGHTRQCYIMLYIYGTFANVS